MTNDRKTQGEWKIQLTMAIEFLYFKDNNETRTIHSKNDNKEIMISNEIDEIIQEIFDFLLEKFLKNLEESTKGTDFVFDSVDLLDYKCDKISLNRATPYTGSPKWLKKSNN